MATVKNEDVNAIRSNLENNESGVCCEGGSEKRRAIWHLSWVAQPVSLTVLTGEKDVKDKAKDAARISENQRQRHWVKRPADSSGHVTTAWPLCLQDVTGVATQRQTGRAERNFANANSLSDTKKNKRSYRKQVALLSPTLSFGIKSENMQEVTQRRENCFSLHKKIFYN